MTFATIRGSPRHSAVDQEHVERAATALSGEFSLSYASPEEVRRHLSDGKNVLLAADNAVAVVFAAGTAKQSLWLMWVEPSWRGRGVGSAMLTAIVSAYTGKHSMLLQCPLVREAFYARHGFQRLITGGGGAYVYMAGPANHPREVKHRLPRALRHLIP